MARPSLSSKILARPRPRRPVAGALDPALDQRLDQLMTIFEQYAEEAERTRLESYGCVVQANEVIRNLRTDIQQAPHHVANAACIVVGERFREVLAEVGLRRELPSQPRPRLFAVPTEERGDDRDEIAA